METPYYIDSWRSACRIRQDIKRSGMLVRGFVDKSRTDITSDGNRGVSVKHAAGRERTVYLAGNDAGLSSEGPSLTISRGRVLSGGMSHVLRKVGSEKRAGSWAALLLYWGAGWREKDIKADILPYHFHKNALPGSSPRRAKDKT